MKPGMSTIIPIKLHIQGIFDMNLIIWSDDLLEPQPKPISLPYLLTENEFPNFSSYRYKYILLLL